MLFTFTRLISLAVLLVSVLGSDGFYKMDFNVLQGQDLSSALQNFFGELNKKLPGDVFGKFNDDNTGSQGDAYEVTIQNEQTFYVANVTIGTPPVSVEVLLDSGSSDLWVMSSVNPQCKTHGGPIDCDQYGTFDEHKSSTWQPNGQQFSISYLDKTYAKGQWGTDTISLSPQLKITNATFAVADDSDSNVGVFGIAYEAQESTKKKYTNIPALMKEQGLINKIAYSLYLGSSAANTGTILFGGIDDAKYTGDLVAIDIPLDNNGNPTLLQIPLSSVGVTIGSTGGSSSPSPAPATSTVSDHAPHIAGPTGGVANLAGFKQYLSSNSSSQNGASAKKGGSGPVDFNNAPVVVDSGTTLTLLPNATLVKVLDQIYPQAQYVEQVGGFLIPCSLKQQSNYLTYNFDNKKTIDVPFTDLVYEAGHDNQGNMICMFGVVPNDVAIVGGNFLKSAYTVFNLDDATISLAQMKYTDDESIQVIY